MFNCIYAQLWILHYKQQVEFCTEREAAKDQSQLYPLSFSSALFFLSR